MSRCRCRPTDQQIDTQRVFLGAVFTLCEVSTNEAGGPAAKDGRVGIQWHTRNLVLLVRQVPSPRLSRKHDANRPKGTDPSGQSPNPQWAGYPHQGQHQTLSSPLVSSQAQSHMSSPVSAPHARSSAYTSVAASQAQSFPNSPVSAPPAQTYKFVPWPGPYRPQQQLQQQQHLQHLQHFQQHQQPQQYQQSLQSQQQLQQYQQLQQQQHQANTPAPMIGYYHQHGSHSAAFNPYYYYDRTVAYPQLPQQQWPNASQAQAQASQAPVQAPQAPQYPPASQHPDQGTKRKRRADASSETFLKRRPWGPGEGETMDAFNFECEKRKALRLSGPDEAAAGMAAAKALATSAIKQEPYDSRPPLMERPLPMPGAYPESSGEMTHGSSGPSFKSEDSFPPSTQQTKAMPPLPPPSQMPAAPVSDEPPLCPEQADLVDLICSGRNVFYTGKQNDFFMHMANKFRRLQRRRSDFKLCSLMFFYMA